jgi:hypothetical protein
MDKPNARLKTEKEERDEEEIIKYCTYVHMKEEHQTFSACDREDAAACERYVIENGLLHD